VQALVFHGKEDVRVDERPRPVLGAPTDAIVRITTTTICGSDLHLFHGEIPDTEKGDVLGHECVGVVEEVGPDVTEVQPGDRVCVSAVIACGTCDYCQKGFYSLCDTTNHSLIQQELYGQQTSGIFGYSHIVGGFDGCQAAYVRVPHANLGLLKLPDDVPDEKAIVLSDILCTGWHANQLSDTGPGDTVAVFGCGPVGLMAMEAARLRGVQRIIAIDNIGYRLDVARRQFQAETINFEENEPVKSLRELTEGRGVDVAIEAAGFRYATSLRHKIQKKLLLETDAVDALASAIRATRKAGRISIIGDFIGYANQFPIGAMMEKSLTVRGGQVYVQQYWHMLLDKIRSGECDPSFVITHKLSFNLAAEAYRLFDQKADNVIKILLYPETHTEQQHDTPAVATTTAA
jgi:threonine dehydrogenase-like Zn-dependent dehydrogenase